MKISTFPILLLVAFFSVLILAAVPASAEEDTRISVQFQDLGLTTQDITVFDSSGDDIIHSNTSSVVRLDYNESTFFTVQLQPGAVNIQPETMYQKFLNFVLNNWIAVFLILVVIFMLAKKR
ncbi:hypothetical protein [Methanoplanus limicola]|uniref:Uncharacterized protein n=1 Tax=Methanoplanus limicola DSM 2279 TaxID=937775 RepID=H1Z1A5_9EURY|nr:hypothetical protein [Methanoplanus limicola]EHQ35372.1 hypothetical protein Metlim_1263 [Methanoplanus limicola DSM 2279]